MGEMAGEKSGGMYGSVGESGRRGGDGGTDSGLTVMSPTETGGSRDETKAGPSFPAWLFILFFFSHHDNGGNRLTPIKPVLSDLSVAPLPISRKFQRSALA